MLISRVILLRELRWRKKYTNLKDIFRGRFYKNKTLEGKIEGRTAERRTHIREMLLDHVPIEKIKQYTSATDEEILEIQRELKQ